MTFIYKEIDRQRKREEDQIAVSVTEEKKNKTSELRMCNAPVKLLKTKSK